MKPVIGIMPLFDEEKNSIWMAKGYIESIENAGGIPLVLPLNPNKKEIDELDSMIDGYIFSGGNCLYSKLNIDLTESMVNVKETIEKMEKEIYSIAKEKNKPLLGICRGMEVINEFEGGTLYYDLKNEHPSAENHMQETSFQESSHTNIVLLETPLNKLLRTERINVNSYHNRGIKQLAKGLRIMVMAQDDLIEGIYDKKRLFLWGLEWHPELMDCESSKMIFKELINKSIEYHNNKKED